MFKATKSIAGGTVHKMPADLKKAILAKPEVYKTWENIITPLGRNEFICWVESAKMIDTRTRRVRRVTEEIEEGKRRPCCWVGCVHRTDKAISPTQKWVMSRNAKKS